MAQSLPCWIASSTVRRVWSSPRRARTPRDFSVVSVRSNPTLTAGGRRRSRNSTKLLTGDQPLVASPPVGDEVRLARPPAGVEGSGDLDGVVLVVLGQRPEVLAGHTRETGGLADRQLIRGGTRCSQGIGVDSGVAGLLAGRELGLGHPSRSGLVDPRDEVRRSDLPERHPRIRRRIRRRTRARTGAGEIRPGRRKLSDGDGGTDVDQTASLGLRDVQSGGDVGLVVQTHPVESGPGGHPRSEVCSAASGPLGGDQPLAGTGIPAREDRGEVLPPDLAPQAGHISGAAEPTTGLLAPVRVVPGWAVDAPRRTGLRANRLWLEVPDDPIDDATDVAPGAAQRGDGELHDPVLATTPAGFPKGNLQMCARRIGASRTTRSVASSVRSGGRGERYEVIGRSRRWRSATEPAGRCRGVAGAGRGAR